MYNIPYIITIYRFHAAFDSRLWCGIGNKQDKKSWGFSHHGLLWHNGVSTRYAKPFQESVPTVIGVLFDGIEGTVKFYKDGVVDLGSRD